MAKRGRNKDPKIGSSLNPFEQYGDNHHRPSRVILFGDDPRNDVWLDALEAFDFGDKSELVALLKSGYPIPATIAPHIGDAIDRYDFKRPANAPRKPSYALTDTDIALSSADAAVDNLLSTLNVITGKKWLLADAVATIAKERGLSASKLTEHHAKRRPSQRKRR